MRGKKYNIICLEMLLSLLLTSLSTSMPSMIRGEEDCLSLSRDPSKPSEESFPAPPSSKLFFRFFTGSSSSSPSKSTCEKVSDMSIEFYS